MEEEDMTAAAYEMQNAYLKNSNRENACIEVHNNMPEIDFEVLRCMWSAIDAYVDINQ